MAAVLLAAISLPAEARAAGPSACLAAQEKTASTADEVARLQHNFHLQKIDQALAVLAEDALGRDLAASASQHGIRINYVAHDHIAPAATLSLPEANTIWVSDRVPDADLPALLGRELYIMKAFHEGRGAAATLMVKAESYLGSFVEASIRENASAWAVSAYLGNQLGFSSNPKAVSQEYHDALAIYQKHSKGHGLAETLNNTIAEIVSRTFRHDTRAIDTWEAEWEEAQSCRGWGAGKPDHLIERTRPDAATRDVIRRMAEIEGTPNLPYPKDDHLAFLSARGDVMVRRWDASQGLYTSLSNPMGPAVQRASGEVQYALGGKRLTQEEWAQDPDVNRYYAELPSGPKP